MELQTPSITGLCLLTAKPARDTTLCLRRLCCHGLIELVDFLIDLGAGLCRSIGCLLASLFELLLGLLLVCIELLLRVVGLQTVSSFSSAELSMECSRLDRTCLRPVERTLRLARLPLFLVGWLHLGSSLTPYEHRLEHQVSLSSSNQCS